MLETFVWVVDDPRGEVLVGALWLGQTGSVLRVGRLRLAFPAPPRPNPRALLPSPATFPWSTVRVGPLGPRNMPWPLPHARAR
jgi:hypothetical protein